MRLSDLKKKGYKFIITKDGFTVKLHKLREDKKVRPGGYVPADYVIIEIASGNESTGKCMHRASKEKRKYKNREAARKAAITHYVFHRAAGTQVHD